MSYCWLVNRFEKVAKIAIVNFSAQKLLLLLLLIYWVDLFSLISFIKSIKIKQTFKSVYNHVEILH